MTAFTGSGVYVFTTKVNLGAPLNESKVVLYVGKTKNWRSRLKSYISIMKGYDDSRTEISYMFSTYTSNLELLFAKVAASDIARVERAIYELTSPEFNGNTPPAA